MSGWTGCLGRKNWELQEEQHAIDVGRMNLGESEEAGLAGVPAGCGCSGPSLGEAAVGSPCCYLRVNTGLHSILLPGTVHAKAN